MRNALAETITNLHRNEQGEIVALTLDPQLEEEILTQMKDGQPPRQNLGLAPEKVNAIFAATAEKMQEAMATTGKALLITNPKIRRYVRAFFEPVLPNLVVLSYADLTPHVHIRVLGSIGVTQHD